MPRERETTMIYVCQNVEFSEILYRKYTDNTHLGLLTETHEVLLRLIKTPNIHIFKMAAPTEDHFPRPYCRSRRGRNGLGSETILTIL